MGWRDLKLKDVEDLVAEEGGLLDALAAIKIHEAEEEKTLQRQTPSFATADVPRRKRTPVRRGTQIPLRLPEEFKNVIGDMARGKELTAAKLVIEKGLYESDVSQVEGRLSIPGSQLISDDFLTEEERQRVGPKQDNRIDVRIVEPSGAVVSAKFFRRDMIKKSGNNRTTTSCCYAIKGREWNEIVARNKLEPGMVVQLWCFRVDGELCFALVPLPPANPAGAGDAA